MLGWMNEPCVDPGHLATIMVNSGGASQLIWTVNNLKWFLFTLILIGGGSALPEWPHVCGQHQMGPGRTWLRSMKMVLGNLKWLVSLPFLWSLLYWQPSNSTKFHCCYQCFLHCFTHTFVSAHVIAKTWMFYLFIYLSVMWTWFSGIPVWTLLATWGTRSLCGESSLPLMRANASGSPGSIPGCECRYPGSSFPRN